MLTHLVGMNKWHNIYRVGGTASNCMTDCQNDCAPAPYHPSAPHLTLYLSLCPVSVSLSPRSPLQSERGSCYGVKFVFGPRLACLATRSPQFVTLGALLTSIGESLSVGVPHLHAHTHTHAVLNVYGCCEAAARASSNEL